MEQIRPEIEGASIVLLGKFNPSIFQPSWLASRKLIRQEEADEETATIHVISPQVTSFSTVWLTLQVIAERFQASTTDPSHFEVLRDLVIGIFGVLEHTPFSLMGVIRDMHFRVPSDEKWHAAGDLLAPKGIWLDILESPGMRSLLMQGGQEEHDGVRTVTYVRVEPSLRVNPGVYIQFTKEFSIPLEDANDVVRQQEAAHKLMAVLASSWRDAIDRGKRVAEQLLNRI